jgi:argininosuccinate lyase/amino-acid N-acetyltransferase
MELINFWSEQGENLPRSREDVLQAIRTFCVVEVDGKVVGCGALYIYGTGLAEVRSLGLSQNTQGKGLGKALVHYLLKQAEYAELKRVIVLTRVPGFFKQLDFRETDKSFLPEKVIKDCDICPRKENCDEVALEFFIA